VSLRAVALGYAALMQAFLLLPVAVLLLYSLQDGQVPFPPFDGPTLKWYGVALDNAAMTDALLHSLAVGALAAGVATLLGFLGAWGVARFAFRWKRVVQWTLLAPSMLSFLIIGLGLLVCLKRVGIPPSLGAVAIGHVVITLPVTFSILLSQFGAQQLGAERAARDLGAADWQVLLLVTAPMVWPGLLMAFTLAFCFSWDEFIIAFLLTRFDVTLPVALWASLRSGLTPAINATGTLVFLLSLGLFALVVAGSLVRDRQQRRLADARG
jgi:spermidine/putrescine transport system permease protein